MTEGKLWTVECICDVTYTRAACSGSLCRRLGGMGSSTPRARFTCLTSLPRGVRPVLWCAPCRFKGLQGAIASTSPTACRLAQRTGMALCGRLCVGPAAATAAGAEAGKGAADRSAGAAGAGGLGLPDAKVYAAAAAEELGG